MLKYAQASGPVIVTPAHRCKRVESLILAKDLSTLIEVRRCVALIHDGHQEHGSRDLSQGSEEGEQR